MAPILIDFVCPTCKTAFQRGRWYVRKSEKKGYARFFCSALCRNNMASKNKPMLGARYRRINVDGKCVETHRHVMEKKLGRKLRRGEEVHHINEDKEDNRADNLELMTKAEHMRHHGLQSITFNIKRAVDLRKRGWTFAQIGTELKRDPSSIWQAFISRGISTEKLDWGKREAERLYSEGCSVPHISRKLGVTHPTIYKHLKQIGVFQKR